jgi:hypothetical protein
MHVQAAKQAGGRASKQSKQAGRRASKEALKNTKEPTPCSDCIRYQFQLFKGVHLILIKRHNIWHRSAPFLELVAPRNTCWNDREGQIVDSAL